MKLLNISTVTEYNDMLGVETQHPLVSVINLSKAKPMRHMRHTFSFYTVFLKDEVNCELIYSRRKYDYIQHKIIELAKDRLLLPDKSISQISYELGFQYPQHFTRLFKNVVGMTPNEFRNHTAS